MVVSGKTLTMKTRQPSFGNTCGQQPSPQIITSPGPASSGTWTEPNSQTRPRSLRSRSVIITRAGGVTELLGGLMYSSGGARTQEQPAFVVADSRASLTITEANFGNNAYAILVRQLRDGKVVFELKPGQTPGAPGGSMIPLWSTP